MQIKSDLFTEHILPLNVATTSSFLLKIKNTVGITDIVVPAEKVVYKFTLEVNKADALRSEIDEIILD